MAKNRSTPNMDIVNQNPASGKFTKNKDES